MVMILEMETAGLMSEQGKVWRIGDIVGYEPRGVAALRSVDCWYVVYVRGVESVAVRALERRGWTVFLPMAERWVQQTKRRLGLRADRRMSKLRKGRAEREKLFQRRIEVPLYPRYVFVAAQTAGRAWWQIQDIPEVSAVIRSDRDTVVRLSPDFIDGLRGRQERGEFVDKEAVNPLRPIQNSRVSIIDGPFAGFTGLVVAGGCDSTVICEVAVFGGATPVEMPLDHIRPLD
jgi:transcription antitermination factor NusG